jgi:succinyl-CoA synthetase beta subunit
MRLLEYQGKELFTLYNIKVPRSHLARTAEEAIAAASEIRYPFVLKSQLSVGGRGKAGAILKCTNQDELIPKFKELVHKEVNGELSSGVLIEEMVDKRKELYMSLFLNRSKRSYALIVSAEGGIEVESIGSKIVIDLPPNGLSYGAIEEIAFKMGFANDPTKSQFIDFIQKLSRMVEEKELELAEINPLAIINDGSLVALDAKVIVDDNAMFRHPELKKYEHISDLQSQAQKSGFSLVELDGNIAIIGNGAGLVMSTLDMMSDAGGRAGSFLDFGGRATTETMYEALKVISKIKKNVAILVNLFGGIVKTNLVAQAIIDAYNDNLIDIPLYARISGAESEKAKEMLKSTKAKLFDTVEEAIDTATHEIRIGTVNVRGNT